MDTLLIIGLAGILLIIGILAIPVDVTFFVTRQAALSSEVVIAWPSGLILYTPKKDKAALRPEAPRPDEGSPTSRRSRFFFDMKDIFRTRGFARRLIKLATDLFRHVHFRVFTIRGRIGLGDPAETGQLWALLCMAAGMLAVMKHVTISPDFDRAVFEVDGQGTFRFIPLQIIVTVMMFMLSLPTLRAVWTGVRRVR